MADIIYIRKEPHGNLMRVTETRYPDEDMLAPMPSVVRYEHRETEQVDHYGSHFTGNFAAVLIGGLAMAVLVLSMAFQ